MQKCLSQSIICLSLRQHIPRYLYQQTYGWKAFLFRAEKWEKNIPAFHQKHSTFIQMSAKSVYLEWSYATYVSPNTSFADWENARIFFFSIHSTFHPSMSTVPMIDSLLNSWSSDQGRSQGDFIQFCSFLWWIDH